jgi:uncharacterized protein YkwD
MRKFVCALILLLILTEPAHAQPYDAEARVLELINTERADQGCPPLRLNAKLTEAAERQSRAMAKHNVFSHTDPDGTTPGNRVHATGYTYLMVGENIEAGIDNPEDAVAGWMRSPGHRANILTCAYRETGIALYDDGEDTRSSYRYYWTQVFAMPLAK